MESPYRSKATKRNIALTILSVLLLVWVIYPKHKKTISKITNVQTESPVQSLVETKQSRIKDSVLILYSYKFKKEFQKYLGVKETPLGCNCGVEINSMLKYCGLPPHNQWCAAAVCKVLGECEIDNPKSGWTPNVAAKSKAIYKKGDSWERFLKKYRSELDSMVLVGSIYIPSKKRDGHTFGIITIKDDYCYTYEGNVDDMCAARKRHISTISKICEYTPKSKVHKVSESYNEYLDNIEAGDYEYEEKKNGSTF